MWRNSILLILLTLPILSFSQRINFKSASFEKALKIAAQEDKYLFIDAYTDWCKPCKWMDVNVFNDSRVAKFYNDYFVSIKIDMESPAGKRFNAKHKVSSYPTFFFFSPEGKLVHQNEGSLGASSFISLGADALDPITSTLPLKKNWKPQKPIHEETSTTRP